MASMWSALGESLSGIGRAGTGLGEMMAAKKKQEEDDKLKAAQEARDQGMYDAQLKNYASLGEDRVLNNRKQDAVVAENTRIMPEIGKLSSLISGQTTSNGVPVRSLGGADIPTEAASIDPFAYEGANLSGNNELSKSLADVAGKTPFQIALESPVASSEDIGAKNYMANLKAAEDWRNQKAQKDLDRENKLREAEILSKTKKEDRGLAVSQKEDQRTVDRLSKMSRDLDPSAMVRGAFSVSKQVIDRADRLRTLDQFVNAYQNGNADSRQIEEVAIGMNSLLSGSNTGAQSQVAALVPKTAIGNASKMFEFLSGNPQGTNQQEFVKRMMGTVENEKKTAENQIKKTRLQRVAQYKDVEEKDPVGFNDVLRSWEIDPDEYQAYKKNGFKVPDVARTDAGHGTAGGFKIISVE